jgi:hypothetical protein
MVALIHHHLHGQLGDTELEVLTVQTGHGNIERQFTEARANTGRGQLVHPRCLDPHLGVPARTRNTENVL